MNDLLTFERFVPGASLGSCTERVEEGALRHWARLYPWDAAVDDEAPAGMATVILMRAYMRTLSPRPPGNVHARQTLQLLSPLRAGEAITTAFECAGKELRRERRYVDVDVSATGEDGRAVFSGRMTLIWAA